VLEEIAAVCFSIDDVLSTQKGGSSSRTNGPMDLLPASHRLRLSNFMGAQGRSAPPVGVTRKLRFWNKVEGLEKLMRHLGLLDKDCSAVNVQVNLNLAGTESAEPVEFKLNRSDIPRLPS
jgi:hypothetical protein